MTKYTIGVYKAYKNSGILRVHKNKTKTHWKHYFIEDENDDEEYSFGSEWVSSFKAVILKRKQLYKRKFVCLECGTVWQHYVPKNTHEMDCPNCND